MKLNFVMTTASHGYAHTVAFQQKEYCEITGELSLIPSRDGSVSATWEKNSGKLIVIGSQPGVVRIIFELNVYDRAIQNNPFQFSLSPNSTGLFSAYCQNPTSIRFNQPEHGTVNCFGYLRENRLEMIFHPSEGELNPNTFSVLFDEMIDKNALMPGEQEKFLEKQCAALSSSYGFFRSSDASETEQTSEVSNSTDLSPAKLGDK